MLKENEQLRDYTENHPLVASAPLNPREAFYGGRTGNTSKHYKCGPGEKIKYIDVCSLYPYVCKYGKFPIGHPKVFVGEECSSLVLKETDGAFCGECTHNDEERSLTGTWIIDEVLKSVEKGYELLEIYEIWKYNVRQYDKEANISGLFTGMMDRFIKIKQQASGWPSSCVTQEQKDQYIENFLHNEDVQLEPDKIVSNSGLRALAKLILNSFWEKFGQRENQPKTRIVRDPGELFAMFIDPGIYVNALLPIREETIIVNYEHLDESYCPLTTLNVMIASTKEHEVVTTTATKIYRPNSAKRKFFSNHGSVPYGYKS
ncbi:hypothetical protein NQ317_000520 [Molorchus minor]|uniref:DNA-directed DNA polymerase n=1 Tax=Molorchus minor TaxID=1323400 RepID=A0ABQ9JA66_9CUCU|nr:hypothetical protein NQ317_000520 [Molorchus minor]